MLPCTCAGIRVIWRLNVTNSQDHIALIASLDLLTKRLELNNRNNLAAMPGDSLSSMDVNISVSGV